MFSMILVWLLSALAIFITSKLVKGFEVSSFGTAMLASVIIGFLNMVIRPLLLLLTLPVNVLTLGLFTFVVNAIVLRMAAGILKNFNIKGWGPAILGALVLVMINMIIFWIFPVQSTH